MKQRSLFRQLFYGWAGRGTDRGYRTVAASPGISETDVIFMEQHPLPVSFSPGSFNHCLRVYQLPSGSTAFSFIKNAGADDLGREGSYYTHFIISSGLHESLISIGKINELFIKDDGKAEELLGKFDHQVNLLQELEVESDESTAMLPDASRYFSSVRDFSYFVLALAEQSVPVVYAASSGDRSETFSDLYQLMTFLPGELVNPSITSFSSSIPDERDLFRVFIVSDDSPLIRNGAVRESAMFLNRQLVNEVHAPIPPGIEGLASSIYHKDMDSVNNILKEFRSMRKSGDAISDLSYCVRRDRFTNNPTLDSAVQLYETAPDTEVAQEYLESIIELTATPDQCMMLSEFFISRLDHSEKEDSSSILNDSVSALIKCENSEILVRHLDSALEIYRRTNDGFPYHAVFAKLDGNVHRTEIYGSLLETKGSSFTAGFIKYLHDSGKFTDTNLILGTASSINDGRKKNRFVLQVFEQSFPHDDWKNRSALAHEYLKCDYAAGDYARKMISFLSRTLDKNDARCKQTLQDLVDASGEFVSKRAYEKLKKKSGSLQ